MSAAELDADLAWEAQMQRIVAASGQRTPALDEETVDILTARLSPGRATGPRGAGQP